MGASALGVLTVTNIPAFLMTATETITHVSLWSASSGGTFHISGALVAERPVVSGDSGGVPTRSPSRSRRSPPEPGHGHPHQLQRRQRHRRGLRLSSATLPAINMVVGGSGAITFSASAAMTSGALGYRVVGQSGQSAYFTRQPARLEN